MLKVLAVLQLIETHHKLTQSLIKKEKTNCAVAISLSAHYLFFLQPSLITSLGSAAWHHMTLLANTVIGGWIAHLIPGIFRPAAACRVEERMRRKERGEGEKEQMMASWLLIARDSPWF